MHDAFEEFANNFEHQAEIPEVFEPLKNVFVNYWITGLDWTEHYVIFSARATVSTLVKGKNVTFIPETVETEIPMEGWNMTSPDDYNSFLLQGVRLSTQFINSLMWFATMTNVTEYRGGAKVLDSMINGTISYTPPVIRVQEDNLLNLHIGRGLLLATCLPTDAPNTNQSAAILFKAEFTNLAGSGRIRLASTDDKTGIRVSLDQLDLSNLNTKPFEPKLPLPEAFEGELVKSAISQLQPVINQYLSRKPLYLPASIAPLAASPQLQLLNTGNGTGYAELLSYCTCDSESGFSFAMCDQRSEICAGSSSSQKSRTWTSKLSERGVSNILKATKQTLDRFGENSDPKSNLKSLRQRYLDKVANYSSHFNALNQNSSYHGIHLTIYDDSEQCSLKDSGSYAKVYWLWMTDVCTPTYLHGALTLNYYKLSQNSLLFECNDDKCSDCQYEKNVTFTASDRTCHYLTKGQSFHLGFPFIYSWQGNPGNVVANVFFTPSYCAYHPRYVEPQMLSAHTNLGPGYHTSRCRQTSKGQQVRNQVIENFVNRAHWDCAQDCFDCGFRLSNVGIDNCHDHRPNVKVIFTRTIEDNLPEISDKSERFLSDYAIIGGSVGTAIVVLFSVALAIKMNMERLKATSKKFKEIDLSFSPFELLKQFTSNIGFRRMDEKHKAQDVIQNLLVLADGCLALVFAEKWNSDTNPLLIIHDKFQSGITVSMDIFETERVISFASRLNFYTSLCNRINAVFAFAIVIVWVFSNGGSRRNWIKARLLSAFGMLATIFVVLAALILTTYFDDLVSLKQDTGFFITDNGSVRKFTTKVIKIALDGVSLTVVSFTIVFLFHGVGGGLFCGIGLFRITYFRKRPYLEILTTLLVIVTVIQPFICLHPVIIWCQDSNANATFLILVIMIWFLPVCVHVLGRTLSNHGTGEDQDNFAKEVISRQESQLRG